VRIDEPRRYDQSIDIELLTPTTIDIANRDDATVRDRNVASRARRA
jgi:hypothetical protein